VQLRISGTYWRFILLELIKLMGLTATIIVVVGAFALALKPFADGRLGALDALRFMMYATVPMLQYAMPFAAGFAATLAYHRLAQDNELTACFAGGISHKMILMPAAILGLACSSVLFLLTDQAIPQLLLRTQELVTRDASRLISAAVEKREALTVTDSRGTRRAIFAEQFTRPDGPPPAPAYDFFILTGVLAVELDPQGKVLKEVAARRADVWLYRRTEESDTGAVRGITTVAMRLSETVGSVTGRGVFELANVTQSFPLPDAMIEDPKYLSWSQMEVVRAKPETMPNLDRRRREMAGALAERRIVTSLDTDLRDDGQANLRDGAGRTVIIRSAGVQPAVEDGYPLAAITRPGTDPVIEISSTLSDGSIRLQRAKSAVISRAKAVTDAGVSTLDIKLLEVTTTGPRAATDGATAAEAFASDIVGPVQSEETQAAGELSEYVLSGLVPASDPLPELLKLSISEMLALPTEGAAAGGAAAGGSAGPLNRARYNLSHETAEMLREITSKQHERLAASLACVVTIIAGAIMAMRLRDSLPLPVYLWSFIPALAALFTIAGGQSVTYRQGNTGLLLLYGGIAVLTVWTLIQYRKLAMR
jgi:lipopolysaccharide export system permease protein